MLRMTVLLGLLGLLGAVPAPARAEAPPADAANAALTILHLSETASKPVRRDRLRAELRVEASGADAKRVQADINRRMAAAVERAKAVPGLKVETGSYSIWQERPQNAPARWRASQALILTGSDTGELLGLVGDLQGDGLLLGGLVFELAPESARAAQDELTRTALTRLRDRAERIAHELGLGAARIRDVRVGNATGERPVPRPFMQMKAAAASAEAAPPVAEAGEATVEVTVDAEIALEPGEANANRP
jgi:predicted secreted protein